MNPHQGLELYADSLEKRIAAHETLIQQTQWWLSAQDDYDVRDIEYEKPLRDDIAEYEDRIKRDRKYLAEVRRRLANEKPAS